MDSGLRMSKLFNGRSIVLFYACCFVFSVSANNDHEEVDGYRVNWEPARTYEELTAEKHAKHDSILVAEIVDQGHVFAFTPNYTIHELAKLGRITMRIDFNVTLGITMNKVFVEVIEIKQEDIPFSKFHFNSFFPLAHKHRTVDIPIAENYMKKWIKKPNAEIRFMLKFTFGIVSDVRTVDVKRPILIFSSTARPKCGEFACCLTSRLYELEGETYNNLIQPKSVRAQRCVDCIRAADVIPFHNIDNLNLVVHRRLKASEIPPPVQHGRCRATAWSPVQVIYVVPKGNDTEAVIEDVPYFLPTACECVEDANVEGVDFRRRPNDDASLDYIIEQDDEDRVARDRIMKENRKAKAASNTP